jgi:diguanylate cyclase (GGDEF)-like protein
VNAGSILLYLLSLFLVQKKRYISPGLLLTGEVILYTLFSAYFLGPGNYIIFYLYLVLIMQVIIPYICGGIRGGIILVLCGCMLLLLFSGHGATPRIDLDAAGEILSCFNVFSASVGTLIELQVGNFINQVISYSNNLKMESFRLQAHTDPLTGLFNRRYAGEYFRELAGKEDARSYCVSMLDIDDFKKINDTYGHAAGDALLINLAGHMRNHLRKSDILFRWGGEEFLVVLTDVTPAVAKKILEKLRASIQESTFLAEGRALTFTVTIGVAALDTNDVDAGIALCDERLYFGKQHGKNQVVGAPEDTK